MYLSKIKIQNFRTFRETEVDLQRKTILLGENDSGKTNLMLAMTLPLAMSDVGVFRKRLDWDDINAQCRNEYIEFVRKNCNEIKTGTLSTDEIRPYIPCVSITLTFSPDENSDDHYYLKKLLSEFTTDDNNYTLRYRFFLKDIGKLLLNLKEVLSSEDYGLGIVHSLLPLNLFETEITNGAGDKPISYLDLQNFSYSLIPAERDDFSSNVKNIGSKMFVKMLTKKLGGDNQSTIEKGYNDIFETIRSAASVDDLINWQNFSSIENAHKFFNDLELQPNVPGLYSIFNSARLGMKEKPLSGEGLGHRNLLFLVVLLNAMSTTDDADPKFSLLLIEEPDAHLSQSSQLIINSVLNNNQISTSNQMQVIFDTHSLNFIQKDDLSSIVILSDGHAFSFKALFTQEELDYLSRNPNLDIYKFLFAKRVVLVEGPSEELLLRAYNTSCENKINRMTILSFHKGFTKVIDIWKRINCGTNNKLAIIRDFDNEQKAILAHESLNAENVQSFTTETVTLEPEILEAGNNYSLLNELFCDELGWKDIGDKDALFQKWEEEKLTPMLVLCKNISSGNLPNFELPKHIKKAVDWLGD